MGFQRRFLVISNFVFDHLAWHSMLCLYKSSSTLHKRIEGRGIKAIIYIDDNIAAFRGFGIAKSVIELVRHDVLSGGFVINNEKNDFSPKTKRKCLGTIIDTKELTFTVP